ncbi:ATP-grasp domain-containing protein [Lachnotalea glycerini]|uniref:Carbamoyl phosphate synthase ATP-binding domain-containing protein n=1 Tax=Lachnotalea glycerini TaxID=1763509 RepID=A0A371JGK4_9FIRM|nr:ATP-grasp domain-containing protein [Lachnotalea glycerini]RDY31869.1 hypothetical protein CG710_007750 [Lachnotalea glycerini]
MIKVWFNHWFSTSYHIIDLMKKDVKEQIYVIGSNQRYESVLQNVCDEWYEEPILDTKEYIEYCLKFCKEHEVDVFVPRRKMVEISKNKEKFYALNVKVLVDDYQWIAILNDKAKTYESFNQSSRVYIPEYRVVNCLEDFEKAYMELDLLYERLCMKFVRDEGGMSFRIFDKQADHFKALSSYPSNKVSYEEVCKVLKEHKEFQDIILMPYLSGDEISVDCLRTSQGLIAIPRIKGKYRDEMIRYDNAIIEMCEEVLHMFPLENPCNIQFKLLNGKAYLLEINTRMSGGLYMSCLAAKINIPNIALQQLLGNRIHWSLEREEKKVSYIETAQIIGRKSINQE